MTSALNPSLLLATAQPNLVLLTSVLDGFSLSELNCDALPTHYRRTTDALPTHY